MGIITGKLYQESIRSFEKKTYTYYNINELLPELFHKETKITSA